MEKMESTHYQIRNVPTALRKAVRVAAALEGMQISEYCRKALREAVKKSGIQIEKGD